MFPLSPLPYRLTLVCLLLLLLFGAAQRGGRAQEGTNVYLPMVASVNAGVVGLMGAADAPANQAIPNLPFIFRMEDYSDTHPALGGVTISFNTLFLVFTLDTTVEAANAVLKAVGATIIGGMTGTAEQEGLLLLRLPTTSHVEMIAAVEQLRTHPNVKIAVQDSLLEGLQPQITPHVGVRRLPNPSTYLDWSWQVNPAGGNWGMELLRVPQLWNFNHAVAKTGASTVTGVFDTGFHLNHPDLSYIQNFSPLAWDDHGTHVAGTIGATFNNGLGVDGVNPFAHLVLQSYNAGVAWGFFDFLDRRTDLQVVNISLGNNWYQKSPPINPNTNAAAQMLIADQGRIFEVVQKLRVASGQKLPFVLVAAGNDSGPHDVDGNGAIDVNLGVVEARWSSPFTYASLVLGVENIMVVEALQLGAGAGGASRADFSNVKHSGARDAILSAPGVDIVSTMITTPYGAMSGTSMATPHVAGLVSYLLSLDPTLTHAELRQLLLDNAVGVEGGATPRADAFASALDIDRLRGNTNILARLVDIDDGTLDGNQRSLCDGCADFLEEDADGDGGRGDGSVDMADFRRWRDWLLQVEGSPDLMLDGSAEHPKKDVNGNGVAQDSAYEAIFPQGDFNGDGALHRSATAPVTGAVQGQATDLAMLARLFSDPHYTVDELPGLIDSADLDVDARGCLSMDGVTEVRSTLFAADTATAVEERVHTTAQPRHIFTAAINPSGYTLKVTAYGGQGQMLGNSEQNFPFTLGSDDFYKPTCGQIDANPRLQMRHQLHVVGVTIGLPSNDGGHSKSIAESYTSEDALGTANHRVVQTDDEAVSDTNTPIPALGFGDITITLAQAGSHTYTYLGEQYERSVSATAFYEASSSYEGNVAIFQGTFTNSYSQSARLPYPFEDNGSSGGTTVLIFDLTHSAAVEANWSCDGQFEGNPPPLSLVRVITGSPAKLIFPKKVSDCSYNGELIPGRYSFTASAGVHVADSVNRTATYFMKITMNEE